MSDVTIRCKVLVMGDFQGDAIYVRPEEEGSSAELSQSFTRRGDGMNCLHACPVMALPD